MVDRLDAVAVREANGRSFWTKLGVAFKSKNGEGWMLRLDAIPASTDGQYVIHLREPRQDGQRQPPKQQSRSFDDEGDSPF